MKNYNEMADSVLRRIDENVKAQERKKKVLLKTALPLSCMCMIALIGIGVWRFTDIDKKPSDHLLNGSVNTQVQNIPSGTNAPDEESNTIISENNYGNRIEELKNADSLGWIFLDGKLYVQDGKLNGENLDTEEYIGKASDYEGFYQNDAEGEISSELFTVKDMPDALFVKLSNGGSVVLCFEPPKDQQE